MTPTQGEHAQTEALRLADALECRTTSWPDKAFAAAELRRLHAQVAALTAATGVQSNTKTHALLSTMIGLFLRAKEKIGYQPGSAIDKTVAEAVEHLKDWPYPETATPAQPAAPQGVAYAELPDDFPKPVAELEFLLDVARNCGQHMERADRLAASNGQAPAVATLDPWREHLAEQADVIDCNALQRAMVQHGISFPEGGVEHFRAALGEMVNRFVRFATPKAQAAPAAPHPIAPDVAADLERSDWTAEEALRWYAAGKHYDTVPNGDGSSSARILDNGAVASNALKTMSREYAEHKGDVALTETPAAGAVAGPVKWPTTCDGKEQEAWETWAQAERYDMTQHPLHYLFLNERTYAARQGWKAGLLYAVEQMKAAAPTPAAQADSQPAPDVDLIARGMCWEECEALMKETCAQAGVQWDEEKAPQSIAINVMQRLANAAHKVGFTLGKERMAAARAPADSVLEDAARLALTALHSCTTGGYTDVDGDFVRTYYFKKVAVDAAIKALAARKQGGTHDNP